MKTTRVSIGLIVLATVVIGPQGALAAEAAGSSRTAGEETPYEVVSRGPNSRVWQKTVYEPGPSGELYPRLHGYVELATGLHYQNPRGEWVEANEAFEILPGRAVAEHGQHKVSLNYNLNSAGAVEL